MMRPWTLSELEAPLKGHLVGVDIEVSSVSTDSRCAQSGALFVALRGENFDGHQYIQQAADSGAIAALVSADVEGSLPLLRVSDTQRALGKLGAYNRQCFEGTLVAVTGSSGKTTVKNMLAAVLAQRGNTLVTQGNLNNEIGVPLTLLELHSGHEFAVVEMGAARKGDIAWLCELGRPSIALLLNALPAHLEGFGSVADVAYAKAEIFDDLGATGVAVVNVDQPWAGQWRERAGPASIITYGVHSSADIRATEITVDGLHGVRFIAKTPAGAVRISLPLPGRHNVSNALGAVAVGVACELSLEEIQRGLESLKPVAGRLSATRLPGGVTLIDDCYNANPGSVRAAIDVLAGCSGRRTLMLGAMKELGADSVLLHAEVGVYAKNAGLDRLWGVGPELEVAVEAFGEGGRFFADKRSAIESLPGAFAADDTALIKGSRGAAMEVLLEALRNANPGGEG